MSNTNEKCECPFLFPTDKIPTRISGGSIGYDLFSTEEATIPARGRVMFGTGVYAQFPQGYYAEIFGKSGLASKGIIAHCGLIDNDYLGHIKVILFNHTDTDFHIECGKAIAQLVIRHVTPTQFPWMTSLWSESTGGRGTNGFGKMDELHYRQ